MDKAESWVPIMGKKTQMGLMGGCSAAHPLLPFTHSLNIYRTATSCYLLDTYWTINNVQSLYSKNCGLERRTNEC